MRLRNLPVILLIAVILIVCAGKAQSVNNDPVISVNYSLTPTKDCENTFGYGTLRVTNPGSYTISDVNLGCAGTETYHRSDGSPLFPVHYNEIGAGESICLPFQFNLSASSPLAITENIVAVPQDSPPAIAAWDSLSLYSAGCTGDPGMLITIRNGGGSPVTILLFVKQRTDGANYSFVRATSGSTAVENGHAVVRYMVVPAGTAGMILIGLEPYAGGLLRPPDALIRFEGDPTGLADRIVATAVSNAVLSLEHNRDGSGYVVSVSCENRGDTRYLLESMIAREGLNFSSADRTVAEWNPMIELTPGERWVSPRVYDTPSQDPPVYNIAANFTLLFRRVSGNLSLGLIEPTVTVPAPSPTVAPTATPSPAPTCTPVPTVPPGPYVPATNPDWPAATTPTPVPDAATPTEIIHGDLTPTAVPDSGTPTPGPAAVERTGLGDYIAGAAIILLLSATAGLGAFWWLKRKG